MPQKKYPLMHEVDKKKFSLITIKKSGSNAKHEQ